MPAPPAPPAQRARSNWSDYRSSQAGRSIRPTGEVSGDDCGWSCQPALGRLALIPGWGDILQSMSKTSINIDRDIANEAAEILGTNTLRETVNASLRETVRARRRLEVLELFGEEGRFDFNAAERAWGGDT